MVIYLPGQALDETPLLDELTPREIVQELDKSGIGQADAKRAVCSRRGKLRRAPNGPVKSCVTSCERENWTIASLRSTSGSVGRRSKSAPRPGWRRWT